MAERKPQWPKAGDLVIATVETVTDYGAYAKLDENDQRRLLHVSEIHLHRGKMFWHASQKQADTAVLEGKNNWFGNFANA